MRITHIQRLLGHQDLNTTMVYARVHDATVEADYHQAMNEIELQQPPLSNTPIPVDDWPTPTARELADQLFRVPTLDNSV